MCKSALLQRTVDYCNLLYLDPLIYVNHGDFGCGVTGKKAQEFLPSCYQIIVEIGFTFSSLLQGFFFAIPRKFLFSPVLRVEFK